MKRSSYLDQHGQQIESLFKDALTARITCVQIREVFASFRSLSDALQSGANFAGLNDDPQMVGFKGRINEVLASDYKFDFSDKYKLDTDLLDIETRLITLEQERSERETMLRQFLLKYPPPTDFIEEHKTWLGEFL